MALATLNRYRAGAWAVIALLVTLLVTLDLMSSAVQNSAELSRIFVPLLLVNLLGLVLLLVLIGANLGRLVLDYRRRRAGSRLTVRMVVMFVLLSLAPVAVVYYYSLNFLLRGIDSWFDVQIDQAMKDALELSKSSLGLNQRVLLKYTEQLLRDIEDLSETALAISLAELREQSGATELALMNSAGQVITSSNANPTILVPDRAGQEVMAQVREGSDYVGLVPTGPDDLQIRVLVNDPTGRRLILQGLYPTSQHISSMSGKLEDAYDRYQELSFLRSSLKINYSLTLSLVLLFSVLGAVWAAFYSARRLVAPISEIAKGTRAVAAGDYDKQLPLPRARDELAFLVASFNAMTRRIAQARDEAARSKHQVEAQRAYLEAVLGRLSSGVMAFDAERCLRTANQAATQILKLELDPYLSRSLDELAKASPQLSQFVESVSAPLSEMGQEWREEITLYGGEGRQVLLCRMTPFAQPGVEHEGHVLVFDDITALIKAQRDAAWGEVARRLAHEIKNPLTPIQLSAERLRHKYLKTMPEADARVLDRATHTIVQQVEAMKEMVNAFSDYARPPKMQREPLDVDRLAGEVLELYCGADGSGALQVDLDAGGLRVEGDPLRLRQVVHNLVKNAQEAAAGQVDGWVRVTTRSVRERDCWFVELKVQDNGPGFDDAVLPQLFEPYVTTKAKGTGLGLAIVKKIVEEHGGIISAENCDPGGCVILRLPAIECTAGQG
jgi:nitrogen fixation/metabolism regulation signal transduction histidine kinase